MFIIMPRLLTPHCESGKWVEPYLYQNIAGLSRTLRFSGTGTGIGKKITCKSFSSSAKNETGGSEIEILLRSSKNAAFPMKPSRRGFVSGRSIVIRKFASGIESFENLEQLEV